MEGDAASPSSSSSPRSKRRKIHASSEGILHDCTTFPESVLPSFLFFRDVCVVVVVVFLLLLWSVRG